MLRAAFRHMPYRPTTRLFQATVTRRKFGRTACAIPGVSLLITRQATSISATWDKTITKKWIFILHDNGVCNVKPEDLTPETRIALGYDKIAAIDRYVLANFLGDGRALGGAPSVTKEKTEGYMIRCQVLPSADRIRAADLPMDFALSDKHDLTIERGTIATVSGLEALPQRVKTCLSHQKGERLFHRDFGTRFAEYYRLLSGSPWSRNS